MGGVAVKWLPWRLKLAAHEALRFPARLAARRERNARRHVAAADGIVLDFGFHSLSEGLLHGGKVKLTHLERAFECDPRRFNIVYMVSSAMPQFALEYARWAKAGGALLVWNQNGVAYPGWAGAEAEAYNRPMRALRALADHVVYQSDFCQTSAANFLGPCDIPSSVFFNPIDTTKFAPAENSPPTDTLRLLAAGTHAYAERVTSVFDCLAELRARGVNARLTLAGRMQWPQAEAEIRAYALDLGVGDHWDRVAVFTQDEAPELYRRHHLLLHPKYMDPCPTVVLEALACGLPVIGSASGGMPELVPATCGRLIAAATDWNRLLTPSGKELADAVIEVADELQEYSHQAAAHAREAFAVEKWIAAHGEIFELCLAKQGVTNGHG